MLNFVGAFLSLAVAATIASGIVDADLVTPEIVFAGLIGAIFWNLLTWYFGLPSSSSHALIGGVVGSMLAAEGTKGVHGDGLVEKVIVPALVAPVLAFTVAGLGILICYRIVGRRAPGSVNRGFRLRPDRHRQHVLARARHQRRAEDDGHHLPRAGRQREPAARTPRSRPGSSSRPRRRSPPAPTSAAGGSSRRWAARIIKMDPAQGFASQASGAAVILSASHVGFPLSTTHVISGAIMGAGAAKRVSAVRWGVAGNIVVAWVLTLPGLGRRRRAHLRRHAHLRHRRRRAGRRLGVLVVGC